MSKCICHDMYDHECPTRIQEKKDEIFKAQFEGRFKNGILEIAKRNLNKTALELCDYLDISEPTIYKWEKEYKWPQWALAKCGFFIESNKNRKPITCRMCGTDN